MMSNLPKFVYVILGFVGLVLVGNLLLLDYFLVAQRNDLLDFQTRLSQLSESFKLLGGRILTTPTASPSTTSSGVSSGSQVNLGEGVACPISCVALVTMATVSARTPASVATSLPTAATPILAKAEYFVPMGSGSLTPTTTWTNISSAQATFDAASYGSIKAAYFEVFMHVDNGEVHARLYDATGPNVFWTTDVKSSSKTSEFVSAPVTLLPGSKTYKVQMTSNLVTGFLDQARIRIVTQ